MKPYDFTFFKRKRALKTRPAAFPTLKPHLHLRIFSQNTVPNIVSSLNLNLPKHKKMLRTVFGTQNVLRCGCGFTNQLLYEKFKPSKQKMNEQLKTQCNNFLPLLEYKDYIMSLLSKLKQKGKNNTKREALLTTNEIF